MRPRPRQLLSDKTLDALNMHEFAMVSNHHLCLDSY